MAREVALHLLEVRARELGNAEASSTLRLCHRQREFWTSQNVPETLVEFQEARAGPIRQQSTTPPAFSRQQASSCQNLAACLSAHLAAENKAEPD